MNPTDFSKYLTDYLTRYLSHERGSSPNTITAYRDTFVLFITFMERIRNIKAEKLYLKSITKESIVAFLDWLQTERKCIDTTRNLRLATLYSFFRFVQYQNPDNLHEYQSIMSIKLKKTKHTAINYLTTEGIKLLLEQPDTTLQSHASFAGRGQFGIHSGYPWTCFCSNNRNLCKSRFPTKKRSD
jgi:integrase/recombinase XerD